MKRTQPNRKLTNSKTMKKALLSQGNRAMPLQSWVDTGHWFFVLIDWCLKKLSFWAPLCDSVCIPVLIDCGPQKATFIFLDPETVFKRYTNVVLLVVVIIILVVVSTGVIFFHNRSESNFAYRLHTTYPQSHRDGILYTCIQLYSP